eukprot:1495593-Pyramimonas_sp.AAC.1
MQPGHISPENPGTLGHGNMQTVQIGHGWPTHANPLGQGLHNLKLAFEQVAILKSDSAVLCGLLGILVCQLVAQLSPG